MRCQPPEPGESKTRSLLLYDPISERPIDAIQRVAELNLLLRGVIYTYYGNGEIVPYEYLGGLAICLNLIGDTCGHLAGLPSAQRLDEPPGLRYTTDASGESDA